MSTLADSFKLEFPPATTTEREFARYATEYNVDQVLARLGTSGYPELGQACYVFGTGAQPRSTYVDLKEQPGIRVIQYQSLFPPLWFIPSYQGLVKIDMPNMLRNVFEKLAEQTKAVVYIFNATLEARFVERFRSVNKHRDKSFGVKEDPGYLIYVVDEDRDDSPTAMADFLSYGPAGPWKTLFKGLADDVARD